MKIIKKIYSNVVESNHARCVLINKNNEVALIHNKKADIFKIPGGTLENNETIEEGLSREVYEETGVKEFTILLELGTVEVIRIDKFVINGIYKQNNYVYLCKTNDLKVNPHFTEKERNERFETKFVDFETCIRMINEKLENINHYQEPYKSQLERDSFLLKEGISVYLDQQIKK